MTKFAVGVEKELDGEEMIDFLARVYGPNYFEARSVFHMIFNHEPSLHAKNFITARTSRGHLIGAVRIVDRKIFIDGAELECGGISSVGVHAQWRGQGVCSVLMHQAIKVMKERGKDLSVLHGRRAVDGFYGQFGYQGVGRYIDLEVDFPASSRISVKVEPFKESDLKSIMRFYGETYPGLTGAVSRDEPLWKYLLAVMRNSKERIRVFVCKQNGKSTGYFVLSEKRVMEMVVPESCFGAVGGIFQSLHVEALSIHPRHPYYRFCRSRMNTVLKERFALDGGYMARIINDETFLRKIGPALVQRAEVLRVSDQVVRLRPYEIHLGNGAVRKTRGAEDISFENKEQGTRFLLRVDSLADIWGASWNRKKPWIPFLFEGLCYHTSAWDEL